VEQSSSDTSADFAYTSIPIIIGVTGHRDLIPTDVPKLREIVKAELQTLQNSYPHSTLMMLNSLAEGADQLCADVGLEMKIPLIAALPLQPDEYRHDFSDQALITFNRQCAEAFDLFVVQATEGPLAVTREFSYRQAGIYVASHSHVLLALWDGHPATPDGCGTAEAVDFILHANYCGKNTSLFKANGDGGVLHILTPTIRHPVLGKSLSIHLIENINGSLESSLRITDEFNKSYRECTPDGAYGLIDSKTLADAGEHLKTFHQLYLIADNLSVHFRNKVLQSIKWLSIFGVSLVIAFLLYDEMESNLFLLAYGGLLMLSAGVFSAVKKRDWHKKYLEYRALAETLRVQFYLYISGIDQSICEAFTWSQKNEIIWVKKAVLALSVGYKPDFTAAPERIKAAWIESQMAYHLKKLAQTEIRKRINANTAMGILFFSIVVYTVIVGLEFSFPGLMQSIVPMAKFKTLFAMHAGQEIILRSVLKILLGVFSAVTLFLSNYYGKLSINRQASDHEKMTELYKTALQKWEIPGINKEKLLIELAREEIVENGIWLSYSRDNTPSIIL